MRWNNRLDMPPPSRLDSTISGYLRRSANGTASVARTTCVWAVSLPNRASRPRSAGVAVGLGGGPSAVPLPPPPPPAPAPAATPPPPPPSQRQRPSVCCSLPPPSTVRRSGGAPATQDDVCVGGR